MIKLINLNKKYAEKNVLNNISIQINEGDFFSLLGKNGAGKSTLIGILASLIKKDTGKIYIANYDLDIDFSTIKLMIGIVSQDYNFSQFETVLDIILNQAGYYGISKKNAYEKTKCLLKLFDLWDIKDSISMKLSGGMKRRLMIIKALIHDPKILILDEPTSGVDITTRKLIWEFLTNINKNGKTIILTTHYLEEIEQLCNNVAIIHHGKILFETNVQTLINNIDSQRYLITTPDIELFLKLKTDDFQIIKKTQTLLDISFSKKFSLNDLFRTIVENNITVYNITYEKNKLEDLFIKLTS
ncbi:MAG TPA: ABC transporter ATP-binding protein [Candidatus Azoamicus sp. OHIO2]